MVRVLVTAIDEVTHEPIPNALIIVKQRAGWRPPYPPTEPELKWIGWSPTTTMELLALRTEYTGEYATPQGLCYGATWYGILPDIPWMEYNLPLSRRPTVTWLYADAVAQNLKVTYNGKTESGCSVERVQQLLNAGYKVEIVQELPPPPPPGKGYLQVHAFLNSTEISADGRIVETGQTFRTPATLEADPGTYTVKVSYQATEKTYSATVTEGQTTRVDAQFAAPSPPVSGAGALKALAVAGGLTGLTTILFLFLRKKKK